MAARLARGQAAAAEARGEEAARTALADAVLVARAMLDWSQAQVAEAAHVSRSTVERVEHGSPVRDVNRERIMLALLHEAARRGDPGAREELRRLGWVPIEQAYPEASRP